MSLPSILASCRSIFQSNYAHGEISIFPSLASDGENQSNH